MNHQMNKKILSIILLFVCQSASAEWCGRVIHGSKNAQLIPLKGMTKAELKKDDLVDCGAMIITHEDMVWVEMKDQTQFKIAANTFVEFSRPEKQRHQLYRGQVYVTAPPTIKTFELTTPNSVSVFSGGIMLVRYQAKAKETTVASFNRKVVFKNKFHDDAEQTVNTGEMSRFWIADSKIAPSPPELMSPVSVKSALGDFGVSKEDVTELTAVVQRVAAARSKALVADLENWEEYQQKAEAAGRRSIASIPGKGDDTSIDPKEAEVGMDLLKKHLFGDAEDEKMFAETRKPASVKSVEKIKDTEYQSKKAKVSREMKRVLEDIRAFDPESD